jgi:hypothetical protein
MEQVLRLKARIKAVAALSRPSAEQSQQNPRRHGMGLAPGILGLASSLDRAAKAAIDAVAVCSWPNLWRHSGDWYIG